MSKSLVHPCVPFDVLLPIDPSKNSPFLLHSMLSHSKLTLQISKCGSQSVPSNLVLHTSLGQIRIHKTRSFARQQANGFGKIQPVLVHTWPKQTDLHLVASILFRIRLCPSSNTGSSCSFGPGVLLSVSALVLRPDSMITIQHRKFVQV